MNNEHKFFKTEKLHIYISIYILSVVAIYIYGISPLFSYSGLTLDINEEKCAIAISLYLLTIMMLPHEVDTPSHYLFFLLYLMIYIPTLSFYWLNDKETTYILFLSISFLIVEILIGNKKGKIKLRIKNGMGLFKWLFVLYTFCSIILIIKNGGVHFSLSQVDEVSAIRSRFSESGAWGYILNWCAKSFCPLYFVYFYHQKRWGGVIFTLMLQLLLFMTFGFKAFLFSIVLLLLIVYIMSNGENYFTRLTKIFTLGIIISYILHLLDYSNVILFALPYRMLYIPASGQFEYFTFFSDNDYLFFSEGIIGTILNIEYPYSQPIGFIVNQSIHGFDMLSNGNTGAFSYGYADLGIAGMILTSIIIVLIFKIIDGSVDKIPLYIVVSAMSYQMITLNDTNIFISLNSSGILWTVLLLLVLNSEIDSCSKYK